MRGVTSLKEMPGLGKSGTSRMRFEISSSIVSKANSFAATSFVTRSSLGEAVYGVRHHELLEPGVDGGEVAGLVDGVLDALLVTATELGVEDLLEHRGLPLDSGQDAA